MGVLLALCATVVAAASLGCAGIASARSATRPLRVPLPRVVSEERRGPSPSLAGEADLQVPVAWARLRPVMGRIAAKLAVKLAPRCEAKIEVITGGSTFTKSPAAEIEEAIFYYFGHGPPHALPVPIIAKRASARRVWELVGPPPGPISAQPGEPPLRELSPMHGVLVERIAAPNTWATLVVDVRTPVACSASLPRRAYLQSAVERMLQSTRFQARIGPPRGH